MSEVVDIVSPLPNNEAPGPDGVRNENIREAVFMIPHWVTLSNACLRSGQVPSRWRNCAMDLDHKRRR